MNIDFFNKTKDFKKNKPLIISAILLIIIFFIVIFFGKNGLINNKEGFSENNNQKQFTKEEKIAISQRLSKDLVRLTDAQKIEISELLSAQNQ